MIDRILHIIGAVFWRLVFVLVVILAMPFGIAAIAFIACVEWQETRGLKKKEKDLTRDEYYGR